MLNFKHFDPRARALVSRSEERRSKFDKDRQEDTRYVPEVEVEGVGFIPPLSSFLVKLATDKIPVDLPGYNWNKLSADIYAVDIPLDGNAFQAFNDHPDTIFIEAPRAYSLTPEEGESYLNDQSQVRNQPERHTTNLTGKGVCIGVIDLGLDYCHDDFRDAEGKTRIAFLWDQTLSVESNEKKPKGHNFGVEYTEADINEALAMEDPYLRVRHKPVAITSKGEKIRYHGTHVTGIAAGNGRASDTMSPVNEVVGIAPEATIIFVNPARAPQSENFTDSVSITKAVSYIYDKAHKLGMPCVINLSSGSNGGSHDGESLVERCIDQHLTKPSRAFVKSAGNENYWQGHSKGVLKHGETKQLSWVVGGKITTPNNNEIEFSNDETPNELEIWYSSRDRFYVRLINPEGIATDWYRPGETTKLEETLANHPIIITSERFTELNGDAQIFIRVSPRENRNIKDGNWIVELRGQNIRDGRYNAWIDKDARRNQKSYFEKEIANSSQTITPPGTFRRGITVANYNHREEKPSISPSSSKGLTRDNRNKPEISAPGTSILSSGAMGGKNNGFMTPARVISSGTSMAAPFVTGTIALMFQVSPLLTAGTIKGILIASADKGIDEPEFDTAFGYGRLNINRAIRLLKDPNSEDPIA